MVPGATRWIYAATDAGVYRSRDDGGTWQAYNEGLPAGAVAMAVSGINNQLFVALNGDGIYRWRNEGPWRAANNGLADLETFAVSASPQDPQFVLAGARSQGLFRSTDGGDNWTRATGVPGQGAVTDIAFAPNDPQRILALVNPAQLLESRDGGQSWTPRAGSQGVTLTGVSFDPSNPDVAYISSSIGIFRQPGPGQNVVGLPATASFNFTDIAVDPSNSNVLYVSDAYGVVVSTDQGGTFARSTGLPQGGGFKLRALPGNPVRVLAGAFGSGVFVSDDQGATFKLSSVGLNGANVYFVAVDPRNAGVVYASTDGGAVFKTVNGGDSWVEARSGLSQFRPVRLAVDPADSNRIYSGSINRFDPNDGSLARSEDGGATWTSVFPQAPALALALHPTDGQTVWYGTTSGPFAQLGSLYRSRDRGENFQELLRTLNIRGLALDPTDPRNVYAIGELGGVYQLLRSINEGNAFAPGQQTAIQMITVAVDPATPRNVYLGTNGGVFRSTDAGANFVAANAGLPDAGAVLVVSIAIDGRDGTLYAATSSGVFKSAAGAVNWSAAGGGLEDVAVRQVAIDPHTPNGLYAATAGAGVYRSIDGGETWTPTGTNAAIISRESVVGAFDFSGEGVAPGELVTIFGQGIGPSQGVEATAFDPQTGKLPTQLAGVRVFFNDTPAPLLFVRRDQVNVQVPFEMAGLNPARVNIRVEFDGIASNTVQVAALATHPGLFPTPVNLDGSLNSEGAPTKAGSVALLYATGQGVTNPAVETGARPPAEEPFARPFARVRVFIGGMEATVFFSGLAPGFVGLMQMNVEVPPTLAPGRYDVELDVGGRAAGGTGTMWVGP